MGDPPDVPELQEGRAAEVVHRVSDQAPTFDLLAAMNAPASRHSPVPEWGDVGRLSGSA